MRNRSQLLTAFELEMAFFKFKSYFKTDTFLHYSIIKINFKNSHKHMWEMAFQSLQHVCCFSLAWLVHTRARQLTRYPNFNIDILCPWHVTNASLIDLVATLMFHGVIFELSMLPFMWGWMTFHKWFINRKFLKC